MTRREKLEADAKALGMSLDYEPVKLIDNIFACGEEEWIKSMAKGIGSSATAVAMGRTKYKTPAELVLEKVTGKGLPISDDPTTQYRLSSGHHQETALLKWYANVIGYEVALVDPLNPSTSEVKDVSEITDEEWAMWEGKGVVCVDHARYGHPLYPFLFTDPDAVCYPPSRERYALEFKTGDSREFKFKWKTGIYPDGMVGNPGYIEQAREHMAVLNVNRCDVVAGCDFNADNNVVVTVYRDMAKEKDLIDACAKVWKNVETGIIPEFTTLSDTSYANVATMLTPENLSEEDFVVSEEYRDTIEEIFSLKEQKKELMDKCNSIEERINALNVSLISALEGHAHATMPSMIEGKTIYFELGSVSRKTFNKDKLKLEDPETFARYSEVKVTDEKKLTIKEKKTVKAKKR